MSTFLDDIKKLREETGVGIMDARKALSESDGDYKKAKAWLADHAVLKAAKKADRATAEGAVFSYVHQTGKVASLVKLGCETDFVARTEDFKYLGKELAMQIASMDPKNVQNLLKQQWIRDPKQTIEQLIHAHVAKTGENIKVMEFMRMSL